MTKVEEYSANVLAAMIDQAEGDIWTGKVTDLITEFAHTSYYTRIMQTLQDSGAVVQIRRGGRSGPSQWRIIDAAATLVPDVHLPRTKRNTLEARIEALEGLLGGLDVAAALADLALEVRFLKGAILERLPEPGGDDA